MFGYNSKNDFFSDISEFKYFYPDCFIPHNILIEYGNTFKLRLSYIGSCYGDFRHIITDLQETYDLLTVIKNTVGLDGITVSSINSDIKLKKLFEFSFLNIVSLKIILFDVDFFENINKVKKYLDIGYRSFIIKEKNLHKFNRLMEKYPDIELFCVTDRKLRDPSFIFSSNEVITYNEIEGLFKKGINFVLRYNNFFSKEISRASDLLILDKQKRDKDNKLLNMLLEEEDDYYDI